MEKIRLVVIGNGMAGIRAVEEVLTRAPDRFDITVMGDEPRANYNRIMLSPVLAGEKTFADIVTHDEAWYQANGIRLLAGVRAERIERQAKRVTTQCGQSIPYDFLLIATGSKPIMLPVPGSDLPQVVGFRDLDDVNRMIEAADTGRKAVVIGGGLLGLEAANGLAMRGMNVTVVHLLDSLMERQLDKPAALMLQSELGRRGIGFRMEAQTEAILGEERVVGVAFKDGDVIDADLVVMAVGIRPNSTLGAEAGLLCERGIVVGDEMRTSDPSIYAVGECVQHRGQCYGLVAPLFEMAKVCADQLAGKAEAAYVGSIMATRLKVTGIELFSAGDFLGDATTDDIVFRDQIGGAYKKLVLSGDQLVGAVLYGDTNDGAWYSQLIKDGANISALRSRLIFGQAIAQANGGRVAALDASTMSDEMQVCGCNGVCKGAIVAKINEKGLTTLDEVRAHTKASSSCGQCTSLVQQILVSCTGNEIKEESDKALCKCTGHGHDAVRKAIVAQGLKSIPAVREALGWKTADGCHKCRPALNYYLLCAWPGEYVDDQQSRFINERVHGNIQKDGTYSVVPRMWGGQTTPDELRAIAAVADKFQIPTVKLTGGQRIDLLGVKKEDLPAVWADLNVAGMVSGHAYAKGLRTVKTCVGSEWCRFGTQDSTGLGIKLERMCWGSWTPHKIKFAVSGCPRNCAEATIKDFAVVCVEAGYDLVVGGNGGIEVRVTDNLVRVATEEEVLEYAGAFMQLYREEARYLERTAPWIDRVGIDYVRGRLVDDPEDRRQLHERFLYSQRFAQQDPWAERAKGGVDAHEFEPLAKVG